MKITIKKGKNKITIITKDLDLAFQSNVDNLIKLIKGYEEISIK